MKNLSLIIVLIISLTQNCCSSFQENQSDKTIFRNNTPCDSIAVSYDKEGNKTFNCYKENTRSFLITAKNGDTIQLKRHLDPVIIENLKYANNQLEYAALNMLINSEGTEINILRLRYKNQKLSIDSSMFYEIYETEDSTFFRPNSFYNYPEPIDSIKVSKWLDYYPTFKMIDKLEYSSISAFKNQWFFLSQEGLSDSVKSILIQSRSNDPEILSSLTLMYISPKIYNWNKEFLTRFDHFK